MHLTGAEIVKNASGKDPEAPVNKINNAKNSLFVPVILRQVLVSVNSVL